MAVTPVREQWILLGDVTSATRLLTDAGYVVLRQEERGRRRMQRDFGKRIMSRLLGEFFVSKRMLPISASIELESIESGTLVDMLVMNRGFWGVTHAGLHGKYLARFEEIVEEAKALLPAVDAAPRESGRCPSERPEDRAFDRLQVIRQLAEEGLVTPEESAQLRQRILDEEV